MKNIDTIMYSYSKTRELIRSDNSLKTRILKSHILLLPFMLVVISIMAISGSFNIFFFTLSTLKMTVVYSLSFSVVYFLIADRETAENWQDSSTRNENIKGKILLSIKEGAILLVISFIIFTIVLLTGFPQNYEQSYLEENVGVAYPFSYIPSTVELILFVLITIISLISIFTSIYWFYSRGMVITGYLSEKKMMTPESKRFLLCWFANVLPWIFFVLLDGIFLDVRYPDFSTRYLSLKEIFAGKAYFILLIQLVILLVLNAFYIIDGIIANKKRKNFLVIAPQEPVLLEPVSQESISKDSLLEMKKDNPVIASFKETRIIIKSDKRIKERIMNFRIFFLAIHIVFISIFSLLLQSFNIFFFFISFLKYLILYSLILSSIYLLIADRETAENWQDRSKRNENLKGKFLHLIIEGSILFVISLLVLGIMYLAGVPRRMDEIDIDLGSGGIITRTYIPTSIEAILIVSIIILLLLSIFTAIFWFSSRCMVVTSYFTKKKMLNAKSKLMIVSLIINGVIWGVLMPIFLDLAFYNVKFPWNFPVHFPLEEIFEQNPYYLLLIQLAVLVLLNLFYIIDGIIANRKEISKISCHEWT